MPLALAARAGPDDGLAGHVNLELGRVEHLDAEDVVLAAVPCAERLGHRGDTDAEHPAAGPGVGLLPQEVLVAHRPQRDLQALAVLARVGQEAERRAVRERLVPHEVLPPEFRLVHAEVGGRGLHHPFLEEHRLGDPERAPVRHAARRLVAVGAAGGEMRDRDVVGGEGRVQQPDLELARLGVGEERAMVGVTVHPHAEDLAVLAQRHLAVQVHVPREPGRDQVAGLVLDPLHRPLQQDRGQDGADIAGIDRHLVAEAAADVRRDDPDHVLGQLGDQRDRGADDVRRLRRHVHRELGRGPVVVRDRAAALDRRRVRARIVQLQLRDGVRLRERAVGAARVADLPVVDDVVELVDRRALGDRLLGVHDDRQRLVVDVDGLARVLGDVRVVGDDAGDLLALETHLVSGQHGLGVIGERRHPGQVAGRHHLAGEHQVHAGNLPRPAGVDRLDPRVRQRAAQDLHVQHPGQRDVVGVVAGAPDEAVVLNALAASAQPADLDLVQCLRHVAPSVWSASGPELASGPCYPWPVLPMGPSYP